MLILIWTLALLGSLVAYYYNVISKFRNRGVKVDDAFSTIKTTVRIALGMEHSTDVAHRNYVDYPNQSFVGSYIFGLPLLQVYDVDLIKKITIKDFEYFVDHRNMAEGDPLFTKNLVTLRGEEWKEMRTNLRPAFTSSKIRLMVPFMVDVGDQMVLNLKKNIKESGSEYLEVDCKDLMSRCSNDVIASCAFGVKVDSHSDPNNEFYSNGVEITTLKLKHLFSIVTSTLSPWLAKTLRLKMFSDRTRSFFMNLVLSTIENREKNHIFRPDMIHMLMEAKKGKLVSEEQAQETDVTESVGESENSKIIKKWDDIDLVAQAVVFFLAGFDTVSSALSFLLYELAVNPDIQDRLVQEIKETDKNNEGKLDYNAINEMTYMDMVVSEVMRKWPPIIALDRICNKDYNMGKPNAEATEDYIMRKGEGLRVMLWGIHRDPNHFPDPLKFDPERFSEKNKNNIKSCAYSPFGIGPRNCIAMRFALCEVKVLAYILLQHLEVSPGPRTTITSQLEPGKLTVVIKGGHWLRFAIRA